MSWVPAPGSRFRMNEINDDHYGLDEVAGNGTIRLITTGEVPYTDTATGYDSSPGRIGFVSRNHTAATISDDGFYKYTAYPGNFTPATLSDPGSDGPEIE